MAEDVAEFRWEKSLNALEESSFGLVLTSRFQKIKKLMKETNKETFSSKATEICQWLYGLNDAVAECQIFKQQLKAVNKNWICFNPARVIWFEYRMKNRLADIEKNFPDIRNEKGESGSSPVALPPARVTFGDESKILGLDKYKEAIEEVLLEDGFKAIGIIGMGGVGKTTLAREVFNSEKVRKNFSKRIWVCLSDIRRDEEDIKVKIVRCFLEELDYDRYELSNSSVIQLLGILNSQLSDGRYLIVLDDMWHVDDFFAKLSEGSQEESHLSRGLPRDSGGALIVISRLEKVARTTVGEKHLFCLQPELFKNHCWEIFENSLSKFNDNEEAKRKIQNDIANKKIEKDIKYQCHGLPLAAETLAKILSHKT